MNILYIIDNEKTEKPFQKLMDIVIKNAFSIQITGREGAISTIQRSGCDMIILQQETPDTRPVRDIRNHHIKTVLILLTRDKTPELIAEVLSAGADDCLNFDMEPVELQARLFSILRRVHGYTQQILTIGRLALLPEKNEVRIDGTELSLTWNEYRLVRMLVLKKDQIITKDFILDYFYSGEEEEPNPKIIDVMFSKIRRKLRKYQINKPFVTLYGAGYKINQDEFQEQNISEDLKHQKSGTIREYSIPISPGGLSLANRQYTQPLHPENDRTTE